LPKCAIIGDMQDNKIAVSPMPRGAIALQALLELGPRQVGLLVLYQLGLRSGYFHLLSTSRSARRAQQPVSLEELHPVWNLPGRQQLAALLNRQEQEQLAAEAGEILDGRVRLFGGQPGPLRLSLPGTPAHWTACERRKIPLEDGGQPVEDIKWVWEPGRFAWAYTLGRAYHLSGEERYAAAFWRYAEAFLDANPPYLGFHWTSAQEVALRLIAFTFALQVFEPSAESTAGRRLRLAQAIAVHAARIPPTLLYARAQNNNHLLTEAAGLYTAGCVLAGHPSAPHWRSLGWRWFQRGVQAQIAPDGAYSQHSANYQRLMLQIATWMAHLARWNGQTFPPQSCQRLAAATAWLLALVDPVGGRLPNLGPNDGAYIFPLTVYPFADYRPALQAAAAVFLGQRPFPPGGLDEIGLWLQGGSAGLLQDTIHRESQPSSGGHQSIRLHLRPSASHLLTPHVLRSPDGESWAYLRAAQFGSRPGHADQLHLDLWWRGLNIAQDAGTYLYNAAPPWNNALVHSAVHNTLTVDGLDQMTPAGRFLFLHWAQAQVIVGDPAPDGTWRSLAVQHNGYRRLGLLHRRKVTAQANGEWTVEDTLLPQAVPAAVQHQAGLHWLLPDWPWRIDATAGMPDCTLQVQSPYGWISLVIAAQGAVPASLLRVQLVRAGELLYGEGDVSPAWGWSSATYGDKIAALSLRVYLHGVPPLSFAGRWSFI
jgi:hypothetical protein